MTVCILHRQSLRNRTARFYRIEITGNLFGEWSVLREWGAVGCAGRRLIRLYDNLREASVAADLARDNSLKRGYQRDI